MQNPNRVRGITSTKFNDLPDEALIIKSLVSDLTGIKATKLYYLTKTGAFPSPTKLSAKCVRWRVGDIRCWLRNPAFQA